MKSLNVKKIATAAAGAALLGAAFAGAVQVDSSGLSNFPFFSNGAPNLKIVVGAKAWPSDAVAAANIAAMIGNLAYTSKDVTVLGTDLLSCSGGTAASTASTSSQSSVSLAITTPGVNPSLAYQMKTYIEGFLDNTTTDDRNNQLSGAASILPGTSPYLSAGRKVSASESSLAFKGQVTDAQVSKSYTEEEHYFLYGKTQYDTSSKVVKSKNPQVAYEAVFTNPIQVCTQFTPDTDQTGCDSQDTYQTIKHRVKIKLLGVDWIIVGMDNFGTDGSTNSSAILTLGKEVSYKEFMQVGDKVTAPNGVTAKLKDIATSSSANPPVSFEISDANGNVIDTATLSAGGEYNKNGIVIRVFSSFAGLGQTNYAQVSVFSDKLALQNGQSVNTDNTNWQVNLIGGGVSYGRSLNRIQLTRTVATDLNAGDSLNFLDKPQLMQMTFNGLEPTTYDTLSFTTGEQSFPTSTSDTSTTDLSYVYVQSSLTSPFDFSDGLKPTNAKSFYWVTGSPDSNGAPRGSGAQGTVFYRDPTTSNFVPYFGSSAFANNVNYTTAVTTLGIGDSASKIGTDSGTASAGVTVWNQTSGIGTCNGMANGTALAATLPSGYVLSSWTPASLVPSTGSINGTPTTTSSTGFNVLGGTFNVTLKASTVNTSFTGCAAGDQIKLQFVNWNGTISPGQTSGVSSQVQNNSVKYNYGPNFVNVFLNGSGVQTGTATLSTWNAIFIPEYVTTEDSATLRGSWALGVSRGDQSTPHLAPESGTATAGYIGPLAGTNTYFTPGAQPSQTFEVGYITPRGSQLTGLSLTSGSINYAVTLAHALTTLSGAGTATTGNSATNDYHANDTALNANGYIVTVKDIKAAGSSGSTTAGKVTGADGLKPSQSKAFVVTPLDTSSSPLVVSDVAAGSEPMIVVGGPLVNTVAASALSGAPAVQSSDEPVVKVQGDKILVYGYSAADTTSAANSLIGWLSQNADAVTGAGAAGSNTGSATTG